MEGGAASGRWRVERRGEELARTGSAQLEADTVQARRNIGQGQGGRVAKGDQYHAKGKSWRSS
jgi:hypothetical protein